MTETARAAFDRHTTERHDRYARNRLARSVVAKLKTEHAGMDTVPAGMRSLVNRLIDGTGDLRTDETEAIAYVDA